eukprot:gene9704-543_t
MLNTWYWSYHHAVVLNVTGEGLCVMDLSAGDDPIPVDDWLSSFLPSCLACPLATDASWSDTWAYWMQVFGHMCPFPPQPCPVPARPPGVALCGHTITPAFTMRWGQDPDVLPALLPGLPGTMRTQTGGFLTFLRSANISIPAGTVNAVVGTYRGRPYDWLCRQPGMAWLGDWWCNSTLKPD